MTRGDDWRDRAETNVENWGDQGVATLFLAMVEELGEVAEVLERRDIPADAASTDVQQARALICDMTSLGIRTRDYLEATFEDDDGQPLPESEREARREAILDGGVSDPDGVQGELDDLMPLGFQLSWALDDER